MHIHLCVIGKLKSGPERDIELRYADRIRKSGGPVGVTGLTIRESPESRANDVGLRRRQEGSALIGSLPGSVYRIAFDERGKSLSSSEFAALMEKLATRSETHLALLIGGPDGLDPKIRTMANLQISLGRMTWPHQLVRLLLSEQIYRAGAILSGHPYHRE
jgi:23S rRNA (pseudouridine1915-N3)-methyltransferase